MSCGMIGSPANTGQMMVNQSPVFDGKHPRRKTVMSRKAGVYRPTKKHKKTRFL